MSQANEPSQPKPTLVPSEPEGGDPACWAFLVCPECGAIEEDGHREGCPAA